MSGLNEHLALPRATVPQGQAGSLSVGGEGEGTALFYMSQVCPSSYLHSSPGRLPRVLLGAGVPGRGHPQWHTFTHLEHEEPGSAAGLEGLSVLVFSPCFSLVLKQELASLTWPLPRYKGVPPHAISFFCNSCGSLWWLAWEPVLKPKIAAS